MDLLIVYFSLLMTTLFSLVNGNTPKLVSSCRRVKSSDKKHVVYLCPAPMKKQEDVCAAQDTWVEIVADPTLDKVEARELRVAWHVPEVQLGDIIVVYKSIPLEIEWPIFEVIPYANYGFSEIGLYENYIDSDFKFDPLCLGYYTIYWRKSEELASSCLQTNPNWMRLYGLGNMRLWDMIIPGTHDSSAYHTAYHPEDVGLLDNYVFTQEENILEQLIHGARALDLRVGDDGGTYYAHHGPAKLFPFQEVLGHVIHFVERTREIIILDFHDFPIGFKNNEDHMKFFNYIYNQLEPYMIPPSLGWGATLNEIWNTGKTLIVSYNHENTYEMKKDVLWPPITQMWGNVQSVPDLYDYLASVFEKPPVGMWSAQAELTAKTLHVVTNSLGGLRKMAEETNTQVSKWFRQVWGRESHIVAMDFIRSSSIVNIAIEWNIRKLSGITCPKDIKEMEEESQREAERERQRKVEEEERPRKEEERRKRMELAEKKRQKKAEKEEMRRKKEEEKKTKEEEKRNKKKEKKEGKKEKQQNVPDEEGFWGIPIESGESQQQK